MAKIHCARGPKRCPICLEYSKESKYALLEIDPQQNPQATRPMMQLELDGEKSFHVFDVIAYFDSEEEVEKYVKKNGMEIKAKILE